MGEGRYSRIPLTDRKLFAIRQLILGYSPQIQRPGPQIDRNKQRQIIENCRNQCCKTHLPVGYPYNIRHNKRRGTHDRRHDQAPCGGY